MGGKKALTPCSGAPHKPGTRYIVNDKETIAKNKRVIDKYGNPKSFLGNSSSCLNLSFPNKYKLNKRKIAIQSTKKISLSRMRHPCVRSALERNLSANASSRKPKVTFTKLSHPPAFPSACNLLWKKAKSANGKTSAREKPNIPMSRPNRLPCEANTNRLPIIGPVQENDTITKVRAMKKMPLTLLVLALLSAAVLHLAGNSISKAPRKEIPKTRNIKKNIKLASQCVANLLSASGPKISVITNPSKVKI